jgi:OOP family OmpA-OmpF porin
MKKTLLFLLAGAALTLSAQEGQSYGAIQVGEAFRKDTNFYKSGLTYGFSTGHWFTNQWALDLKALRTQQDIRSTGVSSHEYQGLASVLFNFKPGADNWYPYLAAGLGATRVHPPLSSSDQNKLSYHVGVGLMGHIQDRVIAQFDVKAVRVPLSDGNHSEALALLGIGYTWGGGHKAAPVPVPAPAPEPAPEPKPAPAPEPVAPPPPPPAPAPAPEPPKPVVPPAPPTPPPPPSKIVLDDALLRFANGKAELGADAIAAIKKVAKDLKAYPGSYTLEVSGYTSSIGGKAFNKALSKKRADAVAKILVADGIPAAKITTVGMGPEKPIADNKTKEGQAKNRRVEIDVKVKDGKAEIRKTETPLH